MLKTIMLATILALGLFGAGSASANINHRASVYEHGRSFARSAHGFRFYRSNHHRHARVRRDNPSHLGFAGFDFANNDPSVETGVTGSAYEPLPAFQPGKATRPVELRPLHPLLAVASHYIGRRNFTRHGGPGAAISSMSWRARPATTSPTIHAGR